MSYSQKRIIYRPNFQQPSTMASSNVLQSQMQEAVTEKPISTSFAADLTDNTNVAIDETISFRIKEPTTPTDPEQPSHKIQSQLQLFPSNRFSWSQIGWQLPIFIAITLVTLIVVMFASNASFFPAIAYMPKTLPENFTQLGPVETQRLNSSLHITSLYLDQAGQTLRYESFNNRQQLSYCQPDTTTTFNPANALGGCIETINQGQPNQATVYYWHSDTRDHFIYVSNGVISDQQALLIADSVQPRLVL